MNATDRTVVYKTREAKPEPAAASSATATDGTAWWRWTEEYVEGQLDILREAVGQALGMKSREIRDALGAEVDLLRRQLAQLRAEFDADRGIEALHKEIAAARADVPNLPNIEAKIDARQVELEREVTRLRRELAATRDKLADLRVEHSQTKFSVDQLEHKPEPKPAVEVTLQTSDSSFKLKDDDPEAMDAWRKLIENAIESNPAAEASVERRGNGSA